jgi:hypothetical protein
MPTFSNELVLGEYMLHCEGSLEPDMYISRSSRSSVADDLPSSSVRLADGRFSLTSGRLHETKAGPSVRQDNHNGD